MPWITWPGSHGLDHMAWIILIAAGILEVVWSYAMKQSHGFTRLGSTVIMVVTMAGSVGLLALAMRTLPLGTILLGEEASPARIVAAALIVSGLVTMKLASPE